MKRVGLVVAYDGTNYCGWQIQPNGITIQGVLNDTLSELLGEKIETIGASRTDAGVHALGNVAVFDTNTKIPGEKISYALNQRLPEASAYSFPRKWNRIFTQDTVTVKKLMSTGSSTGNSPCLQKDFILIFIIISLMWKK